MGLDVTAPDSVAVLVQGNIIGSARKFIQFFCNILWKISKLFGQHSIYHFLYFNQLGFHIFYLMCKIV